MLITYTIDMKKPKSKHILLPLLTIVDTVSGFVILYFGITTSVSLFHNTTVAYTCSNNQHVSQLNRHNFGQGFIAIILVVISILLLLGLLKYKTSILYRTVCLVAFVMLFLVFIMLGLSYGLQNGVLGPCYTF